MPAPVGYSKVLLGTETENAGPIYRALTPATDPILPDPENPEDPFVGLSKPHAPSIYHNFHRSVEKYADLPCLGVQPIVDDVPQPYEWLTYNQVGARVANAGAGMMHLDLLPRVEDGHRMLAIYMKNSIDWVVCEQAAYSHNAVIVALYETLGPESTQYILNQTQLATIVCTATELPKLTPICHKCPYLKTVVICGAPADAKVQEDAQAVGLTVLSLLELETQGQEHPRAAEPPCEADLATIMYTSGTTGDPKGAMLTHSAMLTVCASTKNYCVIGGRDFTTDTVYLSYLPLAHIFERGAHIHLLGGGARIGFSQGNPLRLLDDIRTLRPTLLIAVPRVLNRIYDGLSAKMLGGKKMLAFLFTAGLRAKLRRLEKRGDIHHGFWDRVLFSKIKAGLGLDRCDFILSGSAPLAPDVLNFCRVVLLATVVEGYGQTETCGGVCASPFDDLSTGFVGSPVHSVELRLESVPDMGYLVSDRSHGEGVEAVKCMGRGEICVRGPLLFSGYYKQPDKTAETLGADGWLRTGDIGLWSPLGQLRIIDRKKNIFKLSQGEYVAPEKIEGVLNTCLSVAQAFVTGDSFHSHLVAIIVPDEAMLRSLAKTQGISNATFRELCDHDVAQKHVKKEIDEAAKRAKLAGFERVREIYLHHELFSVENELLTPTFKLRRGDAQKLFKRQIEQLYERSGDNVAGKNIAQG